MAREKELLGVIEDLIPYAPGRALVTTGPSYTQQPAIMSVGFALEAGGTVRLDLSAATTVVTGKHLRLGRLMPSGGVLYSDESRGILISPATGSATVHAGPPAGQTGVLACDAPRSLQDDPGAPPVMRSKPALQPWIDDTGCLWCTDWSSPGVRPSIWRDGKEWLHEWPGYVVAANAKTANGWAYFEARREGPVPEGWEVWRARVDEPTVREPILAHGANPVVFQGVLHYGVWDSGARRFRQRWMEEPR